MIWNCNEVRWWISYELFPKAKYIIFTLFQLCPAEDPVANTTPAVNTISVINTRPSLDQKLPMELLLIVVKELQQYDIYSIRLTSKIMRAAASAPWAHSSPTQASRSLAPGFKGFRTCPRSRRSAIRCSAYGSRSQRLSLLMNSHYPPQPQHQR